MSAGPCETHIATLNDVISLIAQGDRAGALAAVRPLAADGAGEPHAVYLHGSLLLDLGHAADALPVLAGLLALRPDMNHVRMELAKAHDRLGDRPEAIRLLRDIVEKVPGHSASGPLARLLLDTATPLVESEDFAAALPLLQEAAQYNYTLPDLMSFLGLALLRLEDFQVAEQALRTALQLYPDSVPAMLNLASALDNLNRPEEAEILCRRLVSELAPEMPHAWSNLGATLRSQGRFDEAEDAFGKALALDPAFVPALANLGTSHSLQDRFDRSHRFYRRALCLDADLPVLRFLIACDRLKAGDWEAGWDFYEDRRRYKVQWPEIAALPLWPGGDPAGRRILLACEQGYGDALHFFRYAGLLADRGAQVGLVAPPALVRLFSISDPRIHMVERGTEGAPADWDFGVPLMSLPHRFATRVGTMPAPMPYLAFDKAEAKAWAGRLSALPGKKVGLVWAGDPRPYNPGAAGIDSRRSLHVSALAPLATVPALSFVSLQKGRPAEQIADCPFPIHDWTGELRDFADTAALASQLDLIVSVDTSVAHLAGGLGRPVMLLSRYDGCWRWLNGRDDTPWYPSMRLFRQRRWRDWSAPVADLTAALADWAA